MRVPRCSGARFKCDVRALHGAGAKLSKRGSIRTVPVNQSAGPLDDGMNPLV